MVLLDRPWVHAALPAAVFVLVTAAALTMLPRPLRPFEYMVAGALGACATLTAMFVLIARARSRAGRYRNKTR